MSAFTERHPISLGIISSGEAMSSGLSRVRRAATLEVRTAHRVREVLA
jgi:hypothetical protein